MTTIHTLHTTIQFPSEPGDELLPALHTFAFLWPDLGPQVALWTSAPWRDPLLHALIEYATDALHTEDQGRAHYRRAYTFHRQGTAFLAARWLNMSIQTTIAAVQIWMSVAAMLAAVEHDAPELVHALLEQVGAQQQRLLTLLAILQGLCFSYCQTQHVQPTLLALSEEPVDEQPEPSGCALLPTVCHSYAREEARS